MLVAAAAAGMVVTFVGARVAGRRAVRIARRRHSPRPPTHPPAG
ncbi:hypothetical protein NKG94_05320 [Micromonospora sp. M12]